VQYLKSISTEPFKVCVPGPMTLTLPMAIRAHYSDGLSLLEDAVSIVRREMKALAEAGATYLQVDEPRFATSHQDACYLTELFNATREGVPARVGLHLCFGNFKGRSQDYRDYSYLFPVIAEARADQFNLEFANRSYAQLDLLRHFKNGQKIGIGVIDVKSYFVETPEQVTAGIREALRFAAPESLVVTPDCGFNHCPRHIAFRKLRAMVQGAAAAREEFSRAASV